jgi:hypothetical protein
VNQDDFHIFYRNEFIKSFHAPATTFKYGFIYDNAPRPSIWRHPIKWFRWKPNVITFFDLDSSTEIDIPDSLEITFGGLE